MATTEIYQIYYSEQSRQSLDSGFRPLDNRGQRPDWREYWPIRNWFRDNTTVEDRFYGFFSPKFKGKTGLNAAQVDAFINEIPADTQIVSFSPFFDQAAYYINSFEQAESNHPGIFTVMQSSVELLMPGAEINSLVMSAADTIFCNYIVAKPSFWREWLYLCEQLFDVAESGEGRLAALLNADVVHGGEGVPAKVFVIERIASLMITLQSKWRKKAYNSLSLPMSGSPLSGFARELMCLDALKVAALETGHLEYMAAFYDTRAALVRECQARSTPSRPAELNHGNKPMIIEIRHSGQLGDIIYAIPAMKGLAKKVGAEKIHLYITKNKTANHHPDLKHMSGDVMISPGMFQFISPLLERQSCISEVSFVEESSIPATAIDFDVIRSGLLNLSAGNIKDYYFKAFGLLAEGQSSWIEPGFAGRRNGKFDVVIGRSTRYLNQGINYAILNQLGLRVGFIGLEREFNELMARNKGLAIEYVPVSDAAAAADLIASAALFIGNQSLFFALAEALQANRLLEVFEPVPNVIPAGGKCGQFVTTSGLAALLGSVFLCDVPIPNEPANFERNYVLSI
jgi:hypothetical protein